ncbi:MAG TPA: hypothetical protein VHB54_04935 [Mucilaginibacter sp.]|nr:hypothetical protein [Mucilaginibacter sp.]
MKLRFISPAVHGLVDYAAAVALITGPFLLKLGGSSPAAVRLSVITGFAVILVSSLTDYRYSLLRLIPFSVHLAIDLTVATAFIAIPFIFGFTGLDAAYYWINAAVVYLAVAFTAEKPVVLA